MASGGLQERQVKDFRFALAAKIRVVDGAVDSLLSGRDTLISICNKYGLVFIGIPNGFRILHVADVDAAAEKLTSTRNAVSDFPFHMTVPTAGPPRHLAVNSDGSILSVCVSENGACVVHFYDIQGFYDRTKSPAPFFEVKLSVGQEVIDLAWNPGLESSSICAICSADGSVKLMDVKDTGVEVTATLPANTRATCLCWSPKGKQIVVGKADGNLVQYDQQFAEKKCIPPGTGLFGDGRPVSVLDVFWESTLVFFAVYKPVDDDNSEQPWLVAVTLSKDGSSSYEIMEDVCFGAGENNNQKYFMLMIQEWHMLICSSATSAETAVVSRQLDNENRWERWVLDDNSRAEVPMSEQFEDAFPKGVGFSTASQRPVPVGESSTIPPSPMLFLLSSEGLLVCYYMVNTDASAPRFNSRPEHLKGNCTRRRQAPVNTVFDFSNQRHTQQNTSAAVTAHLSSVSKPAVSVQNSVLPLSQFSQLSASSSQQPAMQVLSGAVQQSTLQFGGQAQLSSLLSGSIPQTIQHTPVQSGTLPHVPVTRTLSSAGSTPVVLSSFLGTSSQQPPSTISHVSAPSLATATAAPMFAANKALSGLPVTTKVTIAGGISSGLPLSSGSFNFGKPISQSTPAHSGPRPQQPDATANKLLMPPGRVPAASTTPAAVSKLTTNNVPASIQSMAPANTSLPVGGMQQSVTIDETGAPQKVSSKRRSADTADKLFMHSIEEEIIHFEQELKKMRSRSSELPLNIGETVEKENLYRKTQQLAEIYKGVQSNVKVLNERVSDLKTRCIELFATTAQCEQLKVFEGDPSVKDLLLRQPLDPVRGRKIKEIRTMNSYIDGEISKVDCMLDDQWQQYQYEKSGRRLLKTPTTDIIYQTLTDNMRTISIQKQLLDKLQNSLRKQRLHGSNLPRDITMATDSLTEQLGRRLNVTDNVSTPPSAHINTTPSSTQVDKHAQLRDALSSRKVTPVISAVPKNLTSSKIVSLRDLREMLYVKPSAENPNTLARNRVTQLPDKTSSLSATQTSAPPISPQRNLPDLSNVSKTDHLTTASTAASSHTTAKAVTHESRLKNDLPSTSQSSKAQAAGAFFTSVLQGQNVSTHSTTTSTGVLPSATGLFSGMAASSNSAKAQPSGTGLFSGVAASSNSAKAQPSGTGLFSGVAVPSNSAKAQPSETGLFSGVAASSKAPTGKNILFSAPQTTTPVTAAASSNSVTLSTVPAMSSLLFTHKDVKPIQPLNEAMANLGDEEDEYEDEEGDQEYDEDDGDGDDDEEDDEYYGGDADGNYGGKIEATMAPRVDGVTGMFKTPVSVLKHVTTSPSSANVPTNVLLSQADNREAKAQAFPANSKLSTTNSVLPTVEAPISSSLASSNPVFAGEPGKPAIQSSLTQLSTGSESKITRASGTNTKPVAPTENTKTSFGPTSLSLGSGLFGHKSATGQGQSSFGFTGNDTSKPPAYSSGMFGQAAAVNTASSSADLAVSAGAVPVASSAVASSAPTMLFGKPVSVSADKSTLASATAQPQVGLGTGPQVSLEPTVPTVPGLPTSSVFSGQSQQLTAASEYNSHIVGPGSQVLSADTPANVGSLTLDPVTSNSSILLVPKSDDVVAGKTALDGTSFGFAPATTVAPTVPGSSTTVFGQTALCSNATGSNSGLFGKPATATTSAPTVFGQSAASGTNGFGLFGQQTPSSSSVFGQPTSASPAAFGQPASTASSAFGQPTSASPASFGQPASTASSAFGQPTSASPASFVQPASTASSAFGQPTSASPAAFGQPASTASSAFGQPTSASPASFGQPASTASSAFGQPTSASPAAFGQPASTASSAFGQPTSASPASFGQPASTASSAFGQPTSASPAAFGQPASTASSAFGQPTSASPAAFGQPVSTASSTFGQPAPSNATGFGQLAPTSAFAFGQPSSTTSLFGQPAAGGTSGFGQPSNGNSSIFGQPAQTPSSVFGQSSTSAGGNTGFEFVGGQSTGFGSQPTFGHSAFGQSPASSSMGNGLFGSGTGSGLFGGLGGKPDAAKANTNVFGVSFGASQQPTGLFGQSPAGSSGFGTVKTQANISGAFSGGGGSVESSGFGFQTTQPVANQPGQFGSPPAFGSPAAFGGGPTFGAGATFGSPPQFGSTFGGGSSFSSPFGGKAFGSGDGAGNNAFGSNSSTFAAMAQSNGPTFGSLAQQGGLFGAQQQPQQQQPTFGGFGAVTGGGAQSPFGGSSFASPQSQPQSFTSYRS